MFGDHFSAQLHRRPEFQSFIQDEQRYEHPPGDEQIDSRRDEEQESYEGQDVRHHAGEHERHKREAETGEDVADFGRFAAQTPQKEQVQSSPQEKAEQNSRRMAERGNELHPERDH